MHGCFLSLPASLAAREVFVKRITEDTVVIIWGAVPSASLYTITISAPGIPSINNNLLEAQFSSLQPATVYTITIVPLINLIMGQSFGPTVRTSKVFAKSQLFAQKVTTCLQF